MRIEIVVRALLLTMSLVSASAASAATVFEGARMDYRTGKTDLQIKVTADGGTVRADVITHGKYRAKYRVSVIESADRRIVVNHATRTYMIKPIVPTSVPVSTEQATARRQFAIGSYCPVVNVQISATLSQERCLMDRANLDEIDEASGEAIGGASGVGEFLAIVAYHPDVETLFDYFVDAALPTGSGGFPVIVRNFANGVATGELRLVRVSVASRTPDTFAIPIGFRQVSYHTTVSTQASR